jgi:hypothetical protein
VQELQGSVQHQEEDRKDGSITAKNPSALKTRGAGLVMIRWYGGLGHGKGEDGSVICVNLEESRRPSERARWCHQGRRGRQSVGYLLPPTANVVGLAYCGTYCYL